MNNIGDYHVFKLNSELTSFNSIVKNRDIHRNHELIHKFIYKFFGINSFISYYFIEKDDKIFSTACTTSYNFDISFIKLIILFPLIEILHFMWETISVLFGNIISLLIFNPLQLKLNFNKYNNDLIKIKEFFIDFIRNPVVYINDYSTILENSDYNKVVHEYGNTLVKELNSID